LALGRHGGATRGELRPQPWRHGELRPWWCGAGQLLWPPDLDEQRVTGAARASERGLGEVAAGRASSELEEVAAMAGELWLGEVAAMAGQGCAVQGAPGQGDAVRAVGAGRCDGRWKKRRSH